MTSSEFELEISKRIDANKIAWSETISHRIFIEEELKKVVKDFIVENGEGAVPAPVIRKAIENRFKFPYPFHGKSFLNRLIRIRDSDNSPFLHLTSNWGKSVRHWFL